MFIIWRVQPCGYDAFIYKVKDSRSYTTPSSLFLGLQYGKVLLFCLRGFPLFQPQMVLTGLSIVVTGGLEAERLVAQWRV